jgi:hypothetical protein
VQIHGQSEKKDPRETPIGPVLADVPRAIWQPFIDILLCAPEIRRVDRLKRGVMINASPHASGT